MTQEMPIVQNAYDYWVDSVQRSIIFMDVMRKRGNNYLEHIKEGLPPVLTFPYEIVVNGCTFERPVNYALVKIIDRRKSTFEIKQEEEKRQHSKHAAYTASRKRPIIILDPRAGHGPGIGGSKRDSEVGIALDNGHAVYFALFFPNPQPGQTIADVEAAEVRFVEEVRKRHSMSPRPALVGNCQGGWAAALICADRPDFTGLLVLNGAPLSYWSGLNGVNPMRYRGGLLGGVWFNSFLSDLGHGKFDGVNLVSNFEDLNPANTLWTKQYNLYSQIDTEENRYLAFEKWWGGFYLMTADEIHFIVENLFIGDKLEKGELELRSGRHVSLKDISHPIIVFASKGDNITPPQQALDWIPKVYRSEDEIIELGHVIIYIIHEKIGHLGIFVSGSIAKKEHTEVIGNFDLVEYLAPGLYEMTINEESGHLGETDFEPKFRNRTMKEMLAQVGGIEVDNTGEECGDFRRVSDLSEINDKLYQAFVQPWINLWSDDFTGEMFRRLHPMRMRRYLLSDLNLALLPLNFVAPYVRKNRKPTEPDNPFVQAERIMSDGIEAMLDIYRDTRDRFEEIAFRSIYGSASLECMLPKDINGEKEQATEERLAKAGRKKLTTDDFEAGGFPEAAYRLIILVSNIDGEYDRKEYVEAEKIVWSYDELRRIDPATTKQIIREQRRIVHTDQEKAINALSLMVKDPAKRKELYNISVRLAGASGRLGKLEKTTIARIKKALKV
ncbi:MAG: DUF3141 domain-containing protein [Syntrophales bacterium]|nr:DUF3141 domain-containing protein [Syntrophales bacterium]